VSSAPSCRRHCRDSSDGEGPEAVKQGATDSAGVCPPRPPRRRQGEGRKGGRKTGSVAALFCCLFVRPFACCAFLCGARSPPTLFPAHMQ
jgi:hypothetical protein